MTAHEIDTIPALLDARTTGERDVLNAFLDHMRGAIVRVATGVSEEDARRRLVPSMTTLAGTLRHLTVVERQWFQSVLDGQPLAVSGNDRRDPEATWRVPDDTTTQQLVAQYQAECERSRAVAARYALDDTGDNPDIGKVSLRWILTHMIEETGRHAGHMDILREQIDGATGR